MALMLTGCYAEFEPETDTKPVLCLNSMITAGEPINVDVTHTWLYTDMAAEKNHLVTDAKVTVFANDQVVGSDYLPAEGDRIRIVADSPTYGTASAEVEVPRAASVGNISVKPEVSYLWIDSQALNNGELMADMTFRLTVDMDLEDPADAENYYKFDYNWYYPADDYPDDGLWSSYYHASIRIGGFDYHSEPIFREHISLFESIMGNGLDTEFYFFSDRQISGQTYPLHLVFDTCYFNIRSDADDVSLFDCGVNLYIFNVSRSMYNWAVYKWNIDEGISMDLSDIGLAESKWGYSNVSTGAGVVAARTCAEYHVDLRDFLMQAIAEKLN